MKLNTLLIVIFLACFVPISAQQTQPSPSNEDLQKRITQMETEMREMREELVKIKQASSGGSQTAPQNTTDDSTVAASEKKTETKIETKPNQTVETTKQTKPLGVDIGSARLIPYGTIYFNAFSNSGGTNNTDVQKFSPAQPEILKTILIHLDWHSTGVFRSPKD